MARSRSRSTSMSFRSVSPSLLWETSLSHADPSVCFPSHSRMTSARSVISVSHVTPVPGYSILARKHAIFLESSSGPSTVLDINPRHQKPRPYLFVRATPETVSQRQTPSAHHGRPPSRIRSERHSQPVGSQGQGRRGRYRIES